MKNYILLSLILLFSCKERKTNNVIPSKELISAENQEKKLDKKECIEAQKSFLWKAKIDDNGNDYLIKGDKIFEIKNDLKLISSYLNKLNPPLEVNVIDVKDSILKINFKNEEILTQQLGTTGASQFAASLVYYFTENERVNKIKIDLNEGDHFSPGVYSRNDFKNEFYVFKCK
ncbi:GerMN domain-containing protein [Aquimarina algiphila]|uniref:GerMN domain-containing protein n=1 Tax=Aquimarina algiphila TaxID=2047982 RepID=A0A554VB92_9FLAO|nr:GerMN domain-containing protein [Aquimarina algiphila]TSE03747.1 hypothetical protein FOF46_28660 [Aquimarina algiphila]